MSCICVTIISSSSLQQTGLLGGFLLNGLLSAALDVSRLNSDNTTTPLTVHGDVFVVLSHKVFAQLVQILLVFIASGGDSDAGSGLLVDHLSEAGFSLDNAIWDTLLAAQGRQPADDFNWVNIVSDDDQFGLVVLDQVADVVDSILQDARSLVIRALTLGSIVSLSSKTFLLLGLSLRGQTLHQTSQLSELVLVDGGIELSNAWRDLDALEKDTLLTLETDILWPLDESRQISLWLDISSNSEVTSTLLIERVFFDLGAGSSSERSRW